MMMTNKTTKKLILILTLSFLSVILCLPLIVNAASADYYVSSLDGKDLENDGTILKPFKSINKALSVAQAGDNIIVRAGTYNEKIKFNKSGNSSAGYITLMNFQNECPIIDGTGLSVAENDGLITIENQNYIKIIGFELCNYQTEVKNMAPMGVYVNGSSHHIEIRNCKIHDIKSTAPVTYSSSYGCWIGSDALGIGVFGTNGTNSINNLIIDGNEIYNCLLGSSETLTINGNVENWQVTNNIIRDNNNIGICLIGFEQTAPSNDWARNGVVRNNRIYNIATSGNPAYKLRNGTEYDRCAGGIYVDGGRDLTIEGNFVNYCDLGIEIESEHLNGEALGVTVKNNLIMNSFYTGLYFGGYDSQRGLVHDCTINNNTLYNNAQGIIIQKAEKNNVFNNIIYGGDQLIEENSMSVNGRTVGTMTANNFHHNLWYSTSANSQRPSLFADPKFIDPQAQIFALQSTSPAINAGDPTYAAGVNETDFYGNIRANGIVDIGAFEFGSSTPTVNPASPTPTAPPTTLVPTAPPSTLSPTPTALPASPTPTPTLTPTPIPGTDDGNTRSTASEVQLNTVKSAKIDYSGDKDYFKFTTKASGYYKIQSTGLIDTYGELINGKGTSIAHNDDGGAGNNFYIKKYLNANTTYYLYVDGTQVGSYSILVSTP